MTPPDKAHLAKIKINGFKSILSQELEFGPLSILIGANGAGKTNLISLFTFLRHLSEGKLQSYIEQNGFASNFFHFGPKHTNQIHLDIEIGSNSYNATLEHASFFDSLTFSQEHCTYDGSKKAFSIKGSKGESGLLPGSNVDSEYVSKYTRKYLSQCRVYHFHDTGPTAAFKRASDLNAIDYLYSDAGNIAAFLYYLKNSSDSDCIKSYRKIIKAIQTVAPFFHDFYLEPRGSEGDEKIILKWIHKEHEDPFSANQLSDGTARFICMATLFLQPEYFRPKTIVLDEPELGLHPASLEVLADIVKHTSKNSQVICSTQSVTFANQFSPDNFIVVDQSKGVSSYKRLNPQDLEVWLEDYGMGDIWNKNLIGGRPEW